MDALAQPWIDLKAGINAVWPELTTIWRVHQIQKRNWYDLVANGELVAPWCVVHLPEAVENDEYGVCNVVYTLTPGVYYIASDTGAGIDGVLEAKAALLQDWLLNNNNLSFHVLDSLAINAGDSNPVNMGFRESVMPYSSVSVSFRAMTGYTP